MLEDSSATTSPELKTCAYCCGATPLDRINGVVIKYKTGTNVGRSVMLHKSCAAAWSRRFTQAVPINIEPIDYNFVPTIFEIGSTDRRVPRFD